MTPITTAPALPPLIAPAAPAPDVLFDGAAFMALLVPEISVSADDSSLAPMTLPCVDETEAELMGEGTCDAVPQLFTAEATIAAVPVMPGKALDLSIARLARWVVDGEVAVGEVATVQVKPDLLTVNGQDSVNSNARQSRPVDEAMAIKGNSNQPVPILAAPIVTAHLLQPFADPANEVPIAGEVVTMGAVPTRAPVSPQQVDYAAVPEKPAHAHLATTVAAISVAHELQTVPGQQPHLPEHPRQLPSDKGPVRVESRPPFEARADILPRPATAPGGLPPLTARAALEKPAAAAPPFPEPIVASTKAAITTAVQVPVQTRGMSDTTVPNRAIAEIPPSRPVLVRAPSQSAAERAFATRISPDIPHVPVPGFDAMLAILPQTAQAETAGSTELALHSDADTGLLSALPAPLLATQHPETDLRALAVVDTASRFGQQVMRNVSEMSLPLDVTRQSSPIPITELPQTIVKMVQSEPANSVELRLDPVELGSVRVTMQGTEKDISVVIAVERPDTLDLLRKHADQLLQELRQSGYSGASLTFNMSEQHNPAQRQPRASETAEFDLQHQPLPARRPDEQRRSGGLDMRL